MAALAFGLVGSAFGSMAGLPSLGFTVGSMIGSMLFPTKQPDTFGPQMGDLSVTSSAYGASIPYGFGTMRIAGNVIWASPIQEVVNTSEQSSGKGGKGGKSSGGTTTTYTYYGNWAVGFAHGPAVEVTRIWFDGVLVYNAIDSGGIDGNGTLMQTGLNFRFYKGDEEQLADPLIEAWIAIGNVSPPSTHGTFESGSVPSTPAGEPPVVEPGSQAVPGHRGMVYIVFENWCLSNSGNHLPMVTAEITFSVEENHPYTELTPVAETDLTVNPGAQPNSEILNSGTGVDLVRQAAFRGSRDEVTGDYYLRKFDPSTMDELLVIPVLDINEDSICVDRSPEGDNVGLGEDTSRLGGPPLPLTGGGVSSVFCGPDGKLYVWGPSDSIGVGDRSGLILQVDENSLKETARINLAPLFGLVLPGGIFHWGFVPEFNDSMELHWFLCPAIYDGRICAIDVGPTHYMQFVPVGGAGQADSGTAWAGGGAAHIEPTFAPGTTAAWTFATPNAGLFGNKGMGVFPDPTLIHPAIGMWGHGGPTLPIEIYGIDPKNAFTVHYADLFASDVLPLADVPPTDFSGGMNVAHDPWLDLSTAALIWVVASVPSNEYFLVCWDIATGSIRWVTNLTAQGIPVPGNAGDSYMQSTLTNEQLFWQAGLNKTVCGFNTMDGTVTCREDWPLEIPSVQNDQVWDGYQSSIVSGYGEVKLFVCRHSPEETTVGSIVRALCEKVGLDPATDLDTTDIDPLPIKGYFVGQPTSVRDSILPLAQAYLFDAVESDGVIKFPTRGKPVTRTLTQSADLAPVDAKTNLVVLETRQQEVDLPVYLAVSYYDGDNNYQQGTRIRRRSQVPNQNDVSGAQNAPTVYTQNIAQLQWPIVQTAQQAIEAADKYLYAAWLERTQFKQQVHWGHIDLDPSDVVKVVLDDGVTYTERLTKLVCGADLAIDMDGTSENAAVYDPNVVGGDDFRTEVVGSGPAFTKLILLPTPLLLDTDNAGQTNSVLYFGATNYSSASFPGCGVFKSPDNITWTQVDIDNYKIGWGTTTSVLPDNDDPFSWDDETEFTVRVANGVLLENATDAELLAGGNAMAVFNNDGNPEVIQYGNAEDLGGGAYRLTHLLRGRRGTDTWCEHHGVGRTFVVLKSPSVRNFLLSAGEVGLLRFYRGVGNGLTIDFADTEQLTSEGNDLKPYAPRHVAAARRQMTWDTGFNATYTYSTDKRENDKAVHTGGGGWQTARTTGVLQPGLHYFEVPDQFVTITANAKWGLCNGSMLATEYVGQNGNGVLLTEVAWNFTFTRLRFAVNFTTKLAWYQFDELGWKGAGGSAGNPVTGTNGIDFSGLGSSVYVAYSSSNNNDDARIYSTPADHVYTPPAGYSAGVPDGAIVLSWIRRTRINGDLRDSTGDVPLNEDSEEYEVDIMDAPDTGTVVRAYGAIPEQEKLYPAADVVSDWGGLPETLTLRVYQMSGAVGRGFTKEVEVVVG